MKKLLYFFSICIILSITISSIVFAAGHSASGHDVWNGKPPYINPGSPNYSGSVQPEFAVNNGYSNFSFSGSPYGVYTHSQQVAGNYTYSYTNGLYWDIGRQPEVSAAGYMTFSFSYQKVFNGETYTIYYVQVSPSSPAMSGAQILKDGQYYTVSYDESFSGTQVYDVSLGNQSNCMSVINYFMFGEGDLDYELPAQDIPDESLDIVGLLGSVSDYYPATSDFASGVRGFFDALCRRLINMLPEGETVNSAIGDENLFPSSFDSHIGATVPGCSLIWDSPSLLSSNGSNPIIYTIWIDGYTSGQLKVYGQNTYYDEVDYRKLQIYSNSISYDPSVTFYFNTNSCYQTVLDYFVSNVNWGAAAGSGAPGTYLTLNTCFSRVYIQASQVDDNGDNHFGAVSYVDFSTGSPVVFEGVTDNINDIESSDSDNGTTQTVTQDYTVSGDTIYYGDTITNNNITNNITSGGLVVGDGLGFLNAGISLIRAVLEMIKLLFVSYLIPFITLGWTGHT